jgi:hypothetical protein
MRDDEKDQVALLRHLLGSIDLSDVQDEPRPLSEEESMNRASIASAFWETQFEPVLKRFVRMQEEQTALRARTWEEVMMGRGTVNGLELIREWFVERVAEHHAFSQNETPEQRDPLHPFPSIT